MILVLYVLIALFIAWIWVDYYRLIDIYDAEKLWYIIPTLVLGGLSVSIVLFVSGRIDTMATVQLNGNFFNDFAFCVLRIGLIEEISKAIPFFIIFAIFKDEINEPIDVIAFFSFGALGFAAVENVMYFIKHDGQNIASRAILSSLGHIFFSTILAYGVVLNRFFYKENNLGRLAIFLFLAALAHGIYDFLLIYEYLAYIGAVIMVVFFLFTISIFTTILNNALNNSSYFTFSKVVDNERVVKTMLIYYGIVIIMQSLVNSYINGLGYGVFSLFVSVFFPGVIIIISILRLSRFKLIPGRWDYIKLEMPFGFRTNNGGTIGIMVKGQDYNEASISAYFNVHSTLEPIANRTGYNANGHGAYILDKLFLENDEAFFETELTDEYGRMVKVYLKAKTGNTTKINKQYPIVAVLKATTEAITPESSANDFEMLGWGYLMPIEAED